MKGIKFITARQNPAWMLSIALLIGWSICASGSRVSAQQEGILEKVSEAISELNPMSVDGKIKEWPEKPRQMVAELTKKYGAPDDVTSAAVMWHNPDFSKPAMGSFKHIHVFREETAHNFPTPHTDFLLQVISYQVPLDKVDDLSRFDGSMSYDRTKGELSVMCGKEEMNILAFNLANDIVTGKGTVEDARRAYAETAAEFKDGGKPEITQKFLFDVKRGGTADPDKEATIRTKY